MSLLRVRTDATRVMSPNAAFFAYSIELLAATQALVSLVPPARQLLAAHALRKGTESDRKNVSGSHHITPTEYFWIKISKAKNHRDKDIFKSEKFI